MCSALQKKEDKHVFKINIFESFGKNIHFTPYPIRWDMVLLFLNKNLFSVMYLVQSNAGHCHTYKHTINTDKLLYTIKYIDTQMMRI